MEILQNRRYSTVTTSCPPYLFYNCNLNFHFYPLIRKQQSRSFTTTQVWNSLTKIYDLWLITNERITICWFLLTASHFFPLLLISYFLISPYLQRSGMASPHSFPLTIQSWTCSFMNRWEGAPFSQPFIHLLLDFQRNSCLYGFTT